MNYFPTSSLVPTVSYKSSLSPSVCAFLLYVKFLFYFRRKKKVVGSMYWDLYLIRNLGSIHTPFALDSGALRHIITHIES